MNPSRLLPLALLALAACTSSSAPRLQLPFRTEANCESRSVKQTAIDSIVASIDDTIRPGQYPGDAALRKAVKTGGGGVFAYWRAQPFPAPDTAKALGVTGDLIGLDEPGPVRTTLIRPRTSFVPEMLKSVENL